MAKVIEISPISALGADDEEPLRVAAYCRVSTDHEEQSSSLEMQERYYTRLIEQTPNWINAGIFSEKVSGLEVKKRQEFRKLLRCCRKGKIDLILTKSVSRFGRNTLDSLRALQELQVLGVDVYFEAEKLWLHDRQMQVLMTAYVAFAQAESEGASQSIRWGIKEGFRSGRSGYAEFVCFGYKQDDNGKLVIDEPDAKIVREIFEMRADGKSLGAISDWLYEQGVFSPTGKRRWSRETISKLLKNEKYTGDVLLQKTFVKDLFSGKQVKNVGERERFLYQDHHPAIITRDLFEKANGKSHGGAIE